MCGFSRREIITIPGRNPSYSNDLLHNPNKAQQNDSYRLNPDRFFLVCLQVFYPAPKDARHCSCCLEFVWNSFSDFWLDSKGLSSDFLPHSSASQFEVRMTNRGPVHERYNRGHVQPRTYPSSVFAGANYRTFRIS